MNERCCKCGKKARMTCPALQAPLCSRCCGLGRGFEIQCTVDCESNPFGTAGYQRLIEMNRAFMAKIFKAMVRDGYNANRMAAESRPYMLELLKIISVKRVS